jgi:hypothetical protein
VWNRLEKRGEETPVGNRKSSCGLQKLSVRQEHLYTYMYSYCGSFADSDKCLAVDTLFLDLLWTLWKSNVRGGGILCPQAQGSTEIRFESCDTGTITVQPSTCTCASSYAKGPAKARWCTACQQKQVLNTFSQAYSGRI